VRTYIGATERRCRASAPTKAFKIAWENKQKETKKIWIFSDGQAALKKTSKVKSKCWPILYSGNKKMGTKVQKS
jgi:hypothetical protein